MSPLPRLPWWKEAAVYHVYVRSFADGNGDGVGDLVGLRRHLDYVVSLGVDAIWLSPIAPSPMDDFGYDVAEYCDVDPVFGSLADFDGLVDDAHRLGLRVLVDFVPNHTSDRHPWFVNARSSRASRRRGFYVWRDGPPGARPGTVPPNRWQAHLAPGPAWAWDDNTGQWYLHTFLSSQPDLDWRNPEVKSAMEEVVRFWLDRQVDGLRIDAVQGLGKDPDHPGPGLGDLPWAPDGTHPILRELRRLVHSYPGERVLVGEVFLRDTAAIATYYGQGDELDLAFDFPLLLAPFDAPSWRRCLDEVIQHVDPRGGWPALVLSNHDVSRLRTRYGGGVAPARAAAVALLTLRGTPFLYAGDELGLDDATVTAKEAKDPGGRDGSRAPIPWDASNSHGWPGERPWLPWPNHADRLNVALESGEPASVLSLYRRLLAARKASPALARGTFAFVASPPGTLAYLRGAEADQRATVVNFTEKPADMALPGAWAVEVSTDEAAEGRSFGGRLGPAEAVVLRPTGRQPP
jgi:alpha-glucosidase